MKTWIDGKYETIGEFSKRLTRDEMFRLVEMYWAEHTPEP